MDDTPEDHAAIQPLLSQIVFYPLSRFNGQYERPWIGASSPITPRKPLKIYDTIDPKS
jgi:hypothetical protein